MGCKRRQGATSFFAGPLITGPFMQYPIPYFMSVSATCHARIQNDNPHPNAAEYGYLTTTVARAAGL